MSYCSSYYISLRELTLRIRTFRNVATEKGGKKGKFQFQIRLKALR